MKKFYSFLLAAAVAVSATAAPGVDLKASAPTEKATSSIFSNKAKLAKVEQFNTEALKANTVAAKHKSPAKAAATTMDQLVGIYDYSINVYTSNGESTLNSTTSITKGEGENDIVINGLRYIDVTITGTADFAKGTITCPVQNLLQRSDGSWVKLYTDFNSATNSWADTPLTIKINEDGTLTSDDFIMYGIENKPGYVVAQFDNLKFVTSECNTTVVYDEYDTDDEGYFQNTTTQYTSYCKATYDENYILGEGATAEELGNTVVLEKFFTDNYSGVSNELPLPIIIDRDYNCTYLDPWFFFDITFGGATYRVAPVYFGDDDSVNYIEGTFSENVIQWNVEWVLYLATQTGQGAGVIAKMKNCKLILPFNVENPGAGINDVIADNDNNAPVEYFNLQGMRINEPAAGQLVIRRQGKNVSKLIVK